MENGLHKISDKDYFAMDRLSNSAMGALERSPAHYITSKTLDVPDTTAYRFGRATHCLFLEEEEFQKHWVIAPKFDRRTKEGKAEYEAFMNGLGDRSQVSEDEYNTMQHMMESLHKNSQVQEIMSSGKPEVTCLWEVLVDDVVVPCKGKMDWITDNNIIVDLKTTENASDFRYSARKYAYDRQAAFYHDGLTAVGVKPQGFIFIAVEKTPPYGVMCYYVENSFLEQGRQRYLRSVMSYAECLKAGVWPSYSEELIPLEA